MSDVIQDLINAFRSSLNITDSLYDELGGGPYLSAYVAEIHYRLDQIQAVSDKWNEMDNADEDYDYDDYGSPRFKEEIRRITDGVERKDD